MNGCRCNSPGHCPWHDCITESDADLKRCRKGQPPESRWKPCLYLGEKLDETEKGDAIYVCHQYGKCVLRPNNDNLPSCRGCRFRLRMDEDNFPADWRDPLLVTDRYGKKTDVLRNYLQGGSAFLVCGGPSVNNIPYSRLSERGIFSLGVNNVAGYVPVSAFTCSDPPQKFHSSIFLDPKIMKLIPIPKLGKKRGKLRRKQSDGSFIWLPDKYPEVCANVWGYERRSWLACDQTWFTEPSAAWGNQNAGLQRLNLPETEKCANTMFLGLRLLQYLGAKRIFLLGVDFYMKPDVDLKDNYSFGENRDDSAVRSNNKHYAICNKWFKELRPVFEKFGYETYNCNQFSRLTAFDYVPFETALEDCRGLVDKEPFDLENWYIKS